MGIKLTREKRDTYPATNSNIIDRACGDFCHAPNLKKMLPREIAGKQGNPPDNDVKKRPLAYHVRMSLGFSEIRNLSPALLLIVEVAVVDK